MKKAKALRAVLLPSASSGTEKDWVYTGASPVVMIWRGGEGRRKMPNTQYRQLTDQAVG